LLPFFIAPTKNVLRRGIMETARNKIFTKPEAADFLRVSAVTIDRKRREGILPYHQIGDRVIFTEKDLEIFLKNCEAPRVSRVKK
jgi:hypothetical protein